MVAVEWNASEELYTVTRRGRLVSRHNLARRAKEKGKKLGRKHGEAVTYTGQNGSTKFILKSESSSSSSGSSKGAFQEKFEGLFK